MPPVKNKFNRVEAFRRQRKAKIQRKLQKRLAQSKSEAHDPAAKQKRLAANIPRTLDSAREPDASTQIPSATDSAIPQTCLEPTTDVDSARTPSYSAPTCDPSLRPKTLITTSPKATKATYALCDELVGVFPGAEFFPRQKQGFELGRIAGWASGHGYRHLCVVNEDMKKPNALTLIHLPHGPTAYFKLSSIELTSQIFGHARATAHDPELILNNFRSSLGQAVGHLFQTLFPPIPEFQGRQVVTLHNQRDFLFFRRHRYSFRSTEKVGLQEIGPRFTLKLRSFTNGIPATKSVAGIAKPLTIRSSMDDRGVPASMKTGEEEGVDRSVPPTHDEYLWKWKPDLETSRTTFFL